MGQENPERDEAPSASVPASATRAAPEMGEQATMHASSAAEVPRSGDAASAATDATAETLPPPQTSGDWVGREVRGRYRVLEKLGEGGMGVVYVAEHIHLRKKVAFKVIHPELAANEELLARFTREALATGQLDHAHICAAIDFEQANGSAFLVMPFVPGRSLHVEMERRGALPWRTACRFGAQIADALSAAHALGIVHRDLKPDNVLVETRPDGSEAVKVLDFGVASLTGQANSLDTVNERPLTQAGMILGTPGYMSPEQATAGDVDARTDLYALGVTLWELTAGRRLFDAPDVTRIFAKQFNSIPAPLELGEVGPAHEFSALVTALLDPQKERRPESAAEVRDTLRRLSEAPEPSVARSAVARGQRYLQAQWATLSQRERMFLAGATVAVLGALGAVLGGGDAPPPTPTRAVAESHAEPTPAAKTARASETPEAPEDLPSKSPSLVEKVGRLLEVLPEPLAKARETLFESTRPRERKEAARAVLDYQPADAVPEYLSQSATLELARGCRAKREELRALIDLGDASARPLVERLDRTPRRGCSPFNLRDCLACMRPEISRGLDTLK